MNDTIPDLPLAERAVHLAEQLLQEAAKEATWAERWQAWKLSRMMDDPEGKITTLMLTDQVFRYPQDHQKALRLRDIVEQQGTPDYLPIWEQAMMRIGAAVSQLAPEIVMPLVEAKMRGESAKVVLPGEDRALHKHLKKRRRDGMKMNLNQLGEAILGEEEAAHRLATNLARLADEHCEYISVKISAIFSQIHLIGVEQTILKIKERLRRLYRQAMTHRIAATGGYKFVNLDMEEYRDLRLTCRAFTEVLDEEEFMGLEAGIVLQAYLPDSYPAQQELTTWAMARVARGGSGIKVRIVKGANLAMEQVEAILHDWEQAPYRSKKEVDANFKRMLHYGCEPKHAAAVRLGVASHNLFDIAYTLLLREDQGVEARVELEMLEGMANHQARVARRHANGLLLYAPVVRREDFSSAISYLVRRLDENTADENFLRDLFGMQAGDAKWERQKERFLDACAIQETVGAAPQRLQDRRLEETLERELQNGFHNEADTDWALPANVAWVTEKVAAQASHPALSIPLVIAGEITASDEMADAEDPSCPGIVNYRYALASADQVQQALAWAAADPSGWRSFSVEQRSLALRKVAAHLAKHRGDSIAVMLRDTGKAVSEGDVEFSEAIDFANYYANRTSDAAFCDGTEATPLGTVVITPPWNFPFAIPCGGVLAALAAGNTVIFKPAPEAVWTGYHMCQLLWDAGIPRTALQFLVCPDNEIGTSLLTDDRVHAVILTGAYATAKLFHSWKPTMNLFAETSGKNSLIITNACDPDQAVKDLVRSAFGHAGQKCSAASLAIITAERYDDPAFLRQLRDAAASLTVGSAWELDSIVTPVVRAPGPELLRGLMTLDEGETWLLEPKMIDGNPCLWSPGIKLGIRPGSWYHQTECFGPVLGLMRAPDFTTALQWQNDSMFGLTAGLHSLDPKEIRTWQATVEAGNVYLNRSITGAIVQRQPFGGWKSSCIGAGAKAGGPNYVAQFSHWQETALPHQRAMISEELRSFAQTHAADDAWLMAAMESDAYWWSHEFGIANDPTALICEKNLFRYRAMPHAIIRASEDQSFAHTLRMVAAAERAGVKKISVSSSTLLPRIASEHVMVLNQSDEEFLQRLRKQPPHGVLRAVGASAEMHRIAHEQCLRIVARPVLALGRIEMLPFLREQSLSATAHRYGNLVPIDDMLL
jgi:RHH-type proline utilization regulon transcriptional repressor/proline dehydrogenase/delta 1-pyrroline-5-carboxylate dehydrogenase